MTRLTATLLLSCQLLLAVALCRQPAGAQTPAAETPLPVQPVERELAGGQAHSYTVTLAAGEFVRVIVEQRGVDYWKE